MQGRESRWSQISLGPAVAAGWAVAGPHCDVSVGFLMSCFIFFKVLNSGFYTQLVTVHIWCLFLVEIREREVFFFFF